jgi:sialic acid synthase SpsE
VNPRIIAEIAKEHNGCTTKAMALIDDAALAGTHSVKFQMYNMNDLNEDHPNCERYKECYLSLKKILELRDYADSKDLDFYVSAFSVDMLPRLARHFKKIKIPSTFLTYSDFVKVAIDNFREIHISTGMHSWDLVIQMLDYYKNYIKDKKKFLIPYHCVSLYPTPYMNLKVGRVATLRNRYGIVGYSDHSVGNRACVLASHYGADFIEKHYAFCEAQKPWCWTSDTLKAFQSSIRSETNMVKDSPLSQQEKDNFTYYKTEFNGLNQSQLRLVK